MDHPRADHPAQRFAPPPRPSVAPGPLRIELIGCTSSGKTTLARAMIRAALRDGVEAVQSDALILQRVRAGRLANEFLRRRLVEGVSLPACLLSWPRHGAFGRLVIQAASRAPGTWSYRTSIARIALNKIGVHELVHRFGRSGQVVVLDNEGVLQAAHNLFAHADGSAPPPDLAEFARLAPLPDAAVYLREDESVLIDRTLRRGHRRLPHPEAAGVEAFVRQAVATFESLVRQPSVAERLLILDGSTIGADPPAARRTPGFQRARGLVEDGIRELAEIVGGAPSRLRAHGVK